MKNRNTRISEKSVANHSIIAKTGVALCVLFMAACASKPILGGDGGKNESIGRYAIPRAVIEVKIQLKYDKKFLSASETLSAGDLSLSIEEFEKILVPAAYVDLHYSPDAFSDDTVSIELESHGFLKQVAIDVDDRTGDFITKVADIGITAVKAAAGFPASVFIFDDDVVTQTLTIIVDPYDPNPQHKEFLPGQNVTISIVPLYGSAPMVSGAQILNTPAKCQNKICYPSEVSRKIVFNGPAGTKEERLVIIPDPANLVEVDLVRASLVQKTLTANFSEGMLTKIVTGKPSTALAAAEVPLDILGKIVALPTELIQLKIDTSEKQSELLKQREAMIEATESYIKAREEADTQAAARAAAEEDDGRSGFN